MVMSQLLEKTSFLVDSAGRRTAAVVDISIWEELMKTLEIEFTTEIEPQRVVRMPSVRLADRSQSLEMNVETEQ